MYINNNLSDMVDLFDAVWEKQIPKISYTIAGGNSLQVPYYDN